MNENTERKIRRMERMEERIKTAKEAIAQLREVLQDAQVGSDIMHTLTNKYGWINVPWGCVNDGMAQSGVALADMLQESDYICGQLEQAKGGAK